MLNIECHSVLLIVLLSFSISPFVCRTVKRDRSGILFCVASFLFQCVCWVDSYPLVPDPVHGISIIS
jgi:hypothetical protein